MPSRMQCFRCNETYIPTDYLCLCPDCQEIINHLSPCDAWTDGHTIAQREHLKHLKDMGLTKSDEK